MKNSIFNSPAFWAIMVALVVVPIEEAMISRNKVLQIKQQEKANAQVVIPPAVQKVVEKSKPTITKNTIIPLDPSEGGAVKD